MEQYNVESDLQQKCSRDCLKRFALNSSDRLDFFKQVDNVSQLEAVTRPKMSKLKNIGNTCAIDSVLTALFAHFTELGVEFRNPQRRNIAEWVSRIDEHESIEDLVTMFRSFPSEDNFHIVGQPKDAIEFLMYFLKIYADSICSTKVFKSIKKELVTFASIDRKSSPVQYVPPKVLVESKQVSIHDFIINRNVVDESLGKITTEEIVQSDLVIFAVGRKLPDGRFVETKVFPSPSLTTPNGDRFFLGSIVVVDSSHYLAYVRDRANWYLYDDFATDTKLVGSFSDITHWHPSPMTNGVLYFYFPDYSSIDEHFMSYWANPMRLNVGVFEDESTDKLMNLLPNFKSVLVSDALPSLKRLERIRGDPQLYLYDVKSFLQLF